MIPCSECGTPFQPNAYNQLTCRRRCRLHRNNRQARARYDQQHAADVAAARQEKLTDPGYEAEIERHQKHLRRIWAENGLPVDELLNWSAYHGGFIALDAVKILNGTPR